jgi:uncharacterized protein with beta-barrel porin domain
VDLSGKIWRKRSPQETIRNRYLLASVCLGVTAGLSLLPGPALAASTPQPTSPSLTILNGPSGYTSTINSSEVSYTYDPVIDSSIPVIIATMNNGQSSGSSVTTSYSLNVTVSGTGPVDEGYGTVLGFIGSGGTPDDNYPSDPDEYGTTQDSFVTGPAVTVNDSANITSDDAIAYAAGPGLNTGGVVLAASYGAAGFDNTNTSPDDQVALDNYSGGAGGAVTVDMTGSVTANAIGDAVPYGDLIPTLSGVGAFSFGGAGQADINSNVDYAGSGGDGGTVTVTNSGTIAVSNTNNTPTYGIYAVSEGGEGSSYTNNALGSSVDGGLGGLLFGTGGAGADAAGLIVAIGGEGGNGGAGNTVDVTLNSGGSLSIAGYFAAGVVAQSVGGGGGSGGNADVYSPFAGVSIGGAGGDGGTGGNVTVSNSEAIAVLGDQSFGIRAQSDGGGGGDGGATTAKSLTVPSGDTVPTEISVDLSVGGSGGSGGSGGNVTVDNSGQIVTAGDGAYGAEAQSLGGGGGDGGAATAKSLTVPSGDTVPTEISADISVGGSGGSGGGGNVTVDNSGQIATAGNGAYGVEAQSIGGGGGNGGAATANSVLGGPTDSGTAGTYSADVAVGGSGGAGGNGGNVTVENNGDIVTTGRSADGIVAQSIGGGGGLAGNNNQFPGTTNGNWGGGGAINITQIAGSLIDTSGLYATAIFAQSSGKDTDQSPITIDISGAVIGGTNGGAPVPSGDLGATGIFLSGGDSAGSVGNNTITVGATGSVGTADGIAGTAIETTDSVTALTNAGTITGSVIFGSDAASTSTVSSTMTNNGIFNSGPSVVAASLSNNGVMNIGGPVAGTTNLTGNFNQSSTGTLGVAINSLTGQASLLNVSGTASIAGTVVPTAIALLSGTVTVASASSLSSTATAPSSLLFNWGLAQSGNNLTLTPSANFNPPGVLLTPNEASFAAYLTKAWNSNIAALANQFASLSQLQVGNGNGVAAAYAARLPLPTQTEISALKTSEGGITGAAMSCPVYADATTLLTEDSCVWVKIGGLSSAQYATADQPGYSTTGATYRLGAQKEFLPDWFLGGSLGATSTWASQEGSSSNGETYDGSLALKHQLGHWLLASSLAFASGAYQNERVTGEPGVGVLRSDSNAFMISGRLRTAYDFPFSNWYARTYADLDIVNINTPSFQESGPAGYALDVHSADTTNVVITPALELGGRVNLGMQSLILRYYADTGVSFMPGNDRTVQSSLVGAPATLGTFGTETQLPNVLGDIGVGVQLYQANGFEVKAEYDTQIGSAFFSQGGTLRLAYHF